MKIRGISHINKNWYTEGGGGCEKNLYTLGLRTDPCKIAFYDAMLKNRRVNIIFKSWCLQGSSFTHSILTFTEKQFQINKIKQKIKQQAETKIQGVETECKSGGSLVIFASAHPPSAN